MPRWLPLGGGIVVAAITVLAVIYWQVATGAVGQSRGLVVTNLRSDAVILSFDDGTSVRIEPAKSETTVVKKSHFPQNAHVTDGGGAPLFEQRVDYKLLSDAGYRIAIGTNALVVPIAPLRD